MNLLEEDRRPWDRGWEQVGLGFVTLRFHLVAGFRARKAIFSSSVSENREMYTSETSCIKGTLVLI